MIIECFRCGKEIDTPNEHNADYIMAQDTIVREPRECLIALKHNQATLAKQTKMKEITTVKEPAKVLYALQVNDAVRDKRAKMTETIIDPNTGEPVIKYPDLEITDSDYTKIEVEAWEDSEKLPDIEKVIIQTEDRDTQKPKYPNLSIDDSEYDAVEIPDVRASQAFGEDLVKVIAEVREKDIQKTGIICPECYRDTDFVIWGVHKK